MKHQTIFAIIYFHLIMLQYFEKVYLNQHLKKGLDSSKSSFIKVLNILFKLLKTLDTFSKKGGL